MGTDPLLTLDDYVTGYMTDEQAALYEERLFDQVIDGAGEHHDAALWFDQVFARGLRLERLGIVHPVIRRADFEQILRSPARKVVIGPSELGRSIPAMAEVVLTHLPCEGLSDVDRVDLVATMIDQPEFRRVFEDVPFDADADAIYNCCHGATARVWPQGLPMVLQIVGHRDGVERILKQFGPFEAGGGGQLALYGEGG